MADFPLTPEFPGTPRGGGNIMDLTLTQKPGARKSDRLVIFDLPDRKGSVQFLRTLFGDTVPTSVTISGDFAPPASPKVKETPAERKARLAAMTPAEKLAAAEARIAKAQARIEAQRAKLAASETE